MKQILIILLAISISPLLNAQSVEEGNKQLYYERYLSAQHNFEQILQKQPENGAAVYGLVRAWIGLERPEKANTVLANYRALVQQPYYEVAQGLYLLLQHKKDSAQLFFQQALAQTKEKDPGILSAIAQANISQKSGDPALAVTLLQKAVEKENKNAALQVMLGDAFRKAYPGDGSKGYQCYQAAMNIDAAYAAAYYKMGSIFLTQKNDSYFVHNLDKAINADPNYTPAYYTLYTYYFTRDPKLAMEYYNKYNEHADQDERNEYAKMDLLYLNKQYNEAISSAEKILARDGEQARPRLYKLIAYSYAEQKDSAKALTYMQHYFSKETDSNYIAKDFTGISDFFLAAKNPDSALAYLEKGVAYEKDSSLLFPLYKQIALFYKSKEDYVNEAKYMGLFYVNNPKATNVDLFNWGLEHYRAKEYEKADSVFSLYVSAYPQQGFGYYWKARSQALIDKEMTEGLAVPTYQKLVAVLGTNPTDATQKKWLIESYNYLAAYETNNQKDYAEAIDYFEKVLEIDPNNQDATKYIAVLEKSLSKQEKNATDK